MIIGATSLLPQQEPQYLALITDITGEALAKKAQRAEFEKALWGMQLYEGDKIKTLESSEISLLFSNNNFITLGPNSALTISRGPAPLKNSPEPIRNMGTELFADLSNLALRRTRKGEIGALAGLRYGGAEQMIELLSPGNTKIKTARPSFAWSSKKTFDKFKVKLFGSSGLVWTREISITRLDYPENETPLEYGKSYFWQVEGEGLAESFKSPSVGFNILSEEELQKVAAEEKRVQDMFKDGLNSGSYHFLLGAYYDKQGLLAEAIVQFEMIAKLHAEAPLPHEILGKLYIDIGLKDKAIVELQMALDLRQKE
jgi:tetratricopeptide (TPR) repeat protein